MNAVRGKRVRPRDPKTKAEWQVACDAAHAMLALDSARKYGLVTGGPEADLDRCRAILARGKDGGVYPNGESIEALVCELTGISRCRACGCTDMNACPEGCYWVEPDLCSECVGKEV